MVSVFIIGEKDQSELWLVDTATRTVRPLSDEVGGPVDIELLDQLQSMRAGGFDVSGNVDVVIAAPTHDDLTSREFSESHVGTNELTSREFSANA